MTPLLPRLCPAPNHSRSSTAIFPGDERRKARRGRNEPINAPVSHDPKPLFLVHPNSPAKMRNLTRVVALVSVVFLSSIGALAEKSAEKYTYVLVHGGDHVAHVENPRGVATLIEEAVSDQNNPVQPAEPTVAAK